MKYHLLAMASKKQDSVGRMMRELKDFGSNSGLFDLLNAYRIHEESPDSFMQDHPDMFLTEALAFRVWDSLGDKAEDIGFEAIYKKAKERLQNDEYLQALLDQVVAAIIKEQGGTQS
ncbi:hypothetical protein D3C85_768210 [compost metagenome]